MTDPVQDILARLEGVRSCGADKWEARCPAHDDKHASLSIGRGEGGRALLHCHAGCTPIQVVQALRLRLSALFPPRENRRAGAGHQHAAVIYETPDAAAEALTSRVNGCHVGTWAYCRADGAEALIVLRFNLPDGGKTFRPIHPKDGGWAEGDPPGPLPLYRLADLNGASRVCICEGEKCADEAARLGLTATTSAHGAEAPRKTDWRPLAGMDAVILSDNDKPGEGYGNAVATILTRLDPPATVRIVRLPDLPEGGDIVDFVEARDGQDAETMRAEIESLTATAPPWTAPTAGKTDAGPPDGHDSRPVLTRMADVKAERLCWLWPGRIPLGKVTLVFGDPGLGKSFVTLDIAARVSRGMAWPDAAGERAAPGGVILLSAEDDIADTIRPRLDAAGADVRRIVALRGVEYADGGQGYFNLSCDMPALKAAVEQTPEVRLVIIDPVSAFLGGTDSHKNAEIRGLLAPLADLAAERAVAVVLITHMCKSAGGRALYRAMGSLAFVAASRAGWLVIADAENASRRLFLPAKMNLAKDPSGLAYTLESTMLAGIGPVARVVWESGPVNMAADDALAAAATDPSDRGALTGAVEFLRTMLAAGPMPAKEIGHSAKEAGIAWRTVQRAKGLVGIKAHLEGFGREGRWVWSWPGRAVAPAAAPVAGDNHDPF